jgi:hypothetical protein
MIGMCFCPADAEMGVDEDDDKSGVVAAGVENADGDGEVTVPKDVLLDEGALDVLLPEEEAVTCTLSDLLTECEDRELLEELDRWELALVGFGPAALFDGVRVEPGRDVKKVAEELVEEVEGVPLDVGGGGRGKESVGNGSVGNGSRVAVSCSVGLGLGCRRGEIRSSLESRYTEYTLCEKDELSTSSRP